MKRLEFKIQPPIAPSDSNRADIACFVGFVGRRSLPLPTEIQNWLRDRGWIASPYARPDAESLLHLPVPIDAWEVFHQLFAWEQRPLDKAGQVGTSYLGAAVRSFFAQGGRRCYVVRVGDPWSLTASRMERLAYLSQLLPGYPAAIAASPADPTSWQGIGHLLGLPDVSFVALPDLADAIAADRPALNPDVTLPPPAEQFVECSDPEPLPPNRVARRFQAPRADLQSYDAWATAVGAIANWLARYRRDVQLVAAVPLPMPNSDAADAQHDLLGLLMQPGQTFIPAGSSTPQDFVPPLATTIQLPKGLASAFVQLVYPWVQTAGSANLPEQLESPDAVLVGILARNTLLQGTFRSAANAHLSDVQQLYPSLSSEQLDYSHAIAATAIPHNLTERISILGETPDGLRLLSDVTTSLDTSYRPASVNRLVSVILRAARRLGEEVIFDAAGERLWRRLQETLTGLMTDLLQLGALRDTVSEPFRVVCDRRTMTQADMDNGRVIVQVEFEAAAPIERLTIVLAMSDGGQLSLITPSATNLEAA
jgi:hypothetical protein